MTPERAPAGTKPLPPSSLRRRCDPQDLPFETTDDLEPLDESVGQQRAMEALEFGVGMRRSGYDLFVLGPRGTGRSTTLRRFLEDRAASATPPSDWVYVHNFAEPHRPRAISLAAGRGAKLRADMEGLVEELRVVIPAAFESDEYRTRKAAIAEESKEAHEAAFAELAQRAEDSDATLIHTPTGVALAPSREGKVLDAEELAALPESERQQILENMSKLQADLLDVIQKIPEWERKQRKKLRELDQDVTRFAVGHQIDELRQRYAGVPQVVEQLDAMQQDVLQNTEQFMPHTESELESLLGGPASQAAADVRRYGVNVLVDNAARSGAPVVVEEHPSLPHLMGRTEHVSHLGTLVTDHLLITPGALHRALGGYLMVDARRLLLQPYAWEGLKRALRSREIRIESVAEQVGLASTVTLDPEPIPVDTKVVLIGERLLYYLLSAHDPEFSELFKVPVDFEDQVEWDEASLALYSRWIATVARSDELRPLDRTGVARVIEQAARSADDSRKLATRAAGLLDLLREADYQASHSGRRVIAADDVERAVQAGIRRSARIRDRVQEAIRRGIVRIEVTGARVGQVNGLAVLDLGGFSFGKPTRITARVRLGKGEVLDIEREVELGGPTHSKGVLILAGLLGARYAADRPLSLSASLVFEQSYGGVDGDSASLAELCALLSAIADVPLHQRLAVTGSIDQHGRVQAIGGVNEKVEGFFDVCRESGTSDSHGVIIPAANVEHLMLRPDVVGAADRGDFAVYSVETVDQALELLTGLPAGERGPDGTYPAGTFNQRVETQLEHLADRARAFAKADDKP